MLQFFHFLLSSEYHCKKGKGFCISHADRVMEMQNMDLTHMSQALGTDLAQFLLAFL